MKFCYKCSREFKTSSSLFYHLNEENHFITNPRRGRHWQRDNCRKKYHQSPDYPDRGRRFSSDRRRSSSLDSDSVYETVSKRSKARSTSNKGMNNRFSSSKKGHNSRESSPPRFISSFVSPDRMDISPAGKEDDRRSVLIECKRAEALSDNLREIDRKELKSPIDATNSTSLKDKSSGLKVNDSDMGSKSEESVSIDVANPKPHAKMGTYKKCCPEEGNQPSAEGEKMTNLRKIESSTIRTSAEESNKDSENHQLVIGLESVSATSVTRTSKSSQLKEYIKKQRANTSLEVVKPSSTFLNSFLPFQENEGSFKGSIVQMLHANESSNKEPCETTEVSVDIANGTLACEEKNEATKSHLKFKLSSHKTSKLNNDPTDPKPEIESLSNEESSITEPCVTPEKSAKNIYKASKVSCNVKKETTERSFVSKISSLETPAINDKSTDSKYGCVPRSVNVSLPVKPITPPPMETIPLLIPQLKNKEKKKSIEPNEQPGKKDTSQPKTCFPKPLKFLENVQKMSRDSKRVVADTVPQNNSALTSAGNTNLARDDISNRMKEADSSSSRCISGSSSVSFSLLRTNDLQTPNDESNDSSNVIDSATKSLDKAIIPKQIAKFHDVTNLHVTHLPSIGSDFCGLLPSNEEPFSKSNTVITDTTSNTVAKSIFTEKKIISSEFDEVCISPSAMQLPAIRSYDDPANDLSVQCRMSNEASARDTDTRQGQFPAERSRNRSEPSSEKTQLSNLDLKERNVDTLWESKTQPKSAGDGYYRTAVQNAVSPLSGLPVQRFITLYSTTLWVGPLSKLVTEENLYNTFSPFGEIISIDVIPPRACAYIVMGRRQDAYEALTQLPGYKLQGKAIQLAWAPGHGLKGKDFKDCWEMEQGVSYIPLERIVSAEQLKELEEGGYLEKETIPPQYKDLNQVAMAGKGIDKQSTTKSLYLRRRDLDSKITATFDSVNSTFDHTSNSERRPLDDLGNPPSLELPIDKGLSKIPVEEIKNVSEGLLLSLNQFKNSSHVELESVSDGSVSNVPEKRQNDPILCLENSHHDSAKSHVLSTFGGEDEEKLQDKMNRESQKCRSPKTDSSDSSAFKIKEFSSSNSESSSQATSPRESTSPKIANVQIKEASTAIKNTTDKESNKNHPSQLKSQDDNPSVSASSVENVTRRVDVTESREVEKSKTVKSTVRREVIHDNTSKIPKTESLIESSGESDFSRENTSGRFGGSVDTKKAETSTTSKITVEKEDNGKPPSQLKTQKNLSSESTFSVGSTAHRVSVVESRDVDKSKTTKSAIEQEELSEVIHETEISSKIPKLESLELKSSVTSQVAFKINSDELSLSQPSSKSDLHRENTTHRIEDVESTKFEKSTTAKHTVEEVIKSPETNPKEYSATSDPAEDQESASASEMIPFQCLSEALRQKGTKSVMEPSDNVLDEKTDEKQKLIKERLYENAGFKVSKKFTPFQSYPPMPKTRIAHVPKVPLSLDKKCSALSPLPQKSTNSSEKQSLIHKAHKFCPKENATPLASATIKKESTLKPKHVSTVKAVRKKLHRSSPSSAKVTEDRTTSDLIPEEKAPLVPANLPSTSNSDLRENVESATPQSKDINKFVESSSSPRDISYSRLNAYKCANKDKTHHKLSRNLEASNEDSNTKKVVKPQHCKLESDNVKKTNPKHASITEPTSTFEDTVAAPKPEIGSKKTGSKGRDKLELGQIKKTTPKLRTSSGSVPTSEYPYASVKQEILCQRSESKSSEEERKDKPRESALKEKQKQAPKPNIEEKTTKSKLSAESSSEDSDEIFFQYNRKSLMPAKKRGDSKKDSKSRKRRREKTEESSGTSDKVDRKIKSEILSDDSTCDSTLSKKDSELARRGSLGSGEGPSSLKGTSAKSQIKYYPQAWNDPFCRKCQSMEFELLNTSTCANIYYLKCRNCKIHIVVDMSNEPLC